MSYDVEETQARAELLATMQQANAPGNLSLLAEAAQLLLTLAKPGAHSTCPKPSSWSAATPTC